MNTLHWKILRLARIRREHPPQHCAPTIAGGLKGTSLEYSWANLCCSLCGRLVMQPIWASLSDAFGRKYPFHTSGDLSLVGSIVFAVAQDMKTIIAGRVLQSLGDGGIDILVTMVLADMTTLGGSARNIWA
ncbi:hypothetical protein AC579_7018 [Pseudocercospora musae]|uniref:Major facilitator superfamily (MFS) profile domain-containing protein n=1 Tax=Pseudocercospora musae TaxID=113226 RepID=A0A139IAT9_9PEZI|nr:hypothetical protein AC579_7018 [Pseudocercospora musae]